ncbi:MAG: heavy-metal-associated domain-containing protein [Bacteroidota bacterium]
MIKNIRIIIALVFAIAIIPEVKAQFVSAIVGVDGLTCSSCSFATEKSIRKLDFVDSVYMELDKNMATVFFKKNMPVSVKNLAQKVIDAGFSVRTMDVIFNFNNFTANNDVCFEYENNTYQFVKLDSEKKLNGISTIRFIGEKYLSKKEYKFWKFFSSTPCKNTSPISEQYYVTIR